MLSRSDQEMYWRLRPEVFKCHNEVVFMYKVRRCFTSDNPAKKTSLLHRCNLALLALLVSTTLLAGARVLQGPAESPVKRTEVLSYEGQTVSSVELAGQPDLNGADFMPLIEQRSGEGFSAAKIDNSI